MLLILEACSEPRFSSAAQAGPTVAQQRLCTLLWDLSGKGGGACTEVGDVGSGVHCEWRAGVWIWLLSV